MSEIIHRTFKATVQSYEHILGNYYPAHGSNGFTERNLTFNFSHNYLLENSNAIIWQECPFGKGNHFDTLIIDDQRECVFLVEAKRLNSEGKLNEIVKDFFRIKDHFDKVDSYKELNLTDERKNYKKLGLLLIDVWVSKKKGEDDRRAKLLNELNSEIPFGNEFEKTVVDLNYTEDTKEDGFNEKYHLAYKLFQL